MSQTPQGFEQRIVRLKADLVEQGRRVQRMFEASVEAVFEQDRKKADWVCENDAVIDRVDVEIERAAVEILKDIARSVADLDEDQIRWLLTIVKVNNELERIADEAVKIAERVESIMTLPAAPPDRFRVMANSVIGVLSDTNRSFERTDTGLARTVLASDDAVEAFEHAILRDMQKCVAEGSIDIDFAFAINMITTAMERVEDHCTNIAEQVIYVSTGRIVRHTQGHWSEPEQPI